MASTSKDKKSNNTREQNHLLFGQQEVLGKGSFGIVYRSTLSTTGEDVAVKKVFIDKRFKNRELQILRSLSHPNIVKLHHYFLTTEDKQESDGTVVSEDYLHLVMEYLPASLYRVIRRYLKSGKVAHPLIVKLYIYQLLRSLAYFHVAKYCHRDIKPQNLLVDDKRHILKLCDFGSAKILHENEESVSYICSRYYRAPELIFGSTKYTISVDVWSAGCVAAELILSKPLFLGSNATEQLIEIVKVLGSPTEDDITSMNPNYPDFYLPKLKKFPLESIFRKRTTPDAIDLISRMLVYNPKTRITAVEALAHPYFDELRDPYTCLPNGDPLPVLFDFTEYELRNASPALREKIVPPFVRPSNWTAEKPMDIPSYAPYRRSPSDPLAGRYPSSSPGHEPQGKLRADSTTTELSQSDAGVREPVPSLQVSVSGRPDGFQDAVDTSQNRSSQGNSSQSKFMQFMQSRQTRQPSNRQNVQQVQIRHPAQASQTVPVTSASAVPSSQGNAMPGQSGVYDPNTKSVVHGQAVGHVNANGNVDYGDPKKSPRSAHGAYSSGGSGHAAVPMETSEEGQGHHNSNPPPHFAQGNNPAMDQDQLNRDMESEGQRDSTKNDPQASSQNSGRRGGSGGFAGSFFLSLPGIKSKLKK